jgi:hypothetical protein
MAVKAAHHPSSVTGPGAVPASPRARLVRRQRTESVLALRWCALANHQGRRRGMPLQWAASSIREAPQALRAGRVLGALTEAGVQVVELGHWKRLGGVPSGAPGPSWDGSSWQPGSQVRPAAGTSGKYNGSSAGLAGSPARAARPEIPAEPRATARDGRKPASELGAGSRPPGITPPTASGRSGISNRRGTMQPTGTRQMPVVAECGATLRAFSGVSLSARPRDLGSRTGSIFGPGRWLLF